jgi:hypothetical protein
MILRISKIMDALTQMKSAFSMSRNTFIAILFTIIAVLVPLRANASDEPAVEIVVHKGNTLIGICKEYLTDPRQWRDIARFNRLANPDFILPTQKLLFPVHLLKGTPIDGTVTFIKGKVTVQEKAGKEWRALLLNDRVTQGALLATGEEGAVEITFEDRASFLVKPSSSLKMTTLERKSPDYFLRELYLRSGRAISNLRDATGKGSRFEIRTPSAVAATRGTVFRVAVDDSEATRSEVLNGRIGVEAMKRTVAVSEGEGTFVRKGDPPLEPRKLLPPPAVRDILPIYKSIPLSFRFEKVADAVSYRVAFAKDSAGKDVIREQMIQLGDAFTLYTAEDGTYFLQARSTDNLGLEGIPAEPAVIRIRMNPLPPLIESPVDGAAYTVKAPLFRWLRVNDAVRYHVQVAEDRGFRKIVEARVDMRDVEYKAAGLDFGTYYFRISSVAGDNYQGEWSDALRFTIVPLSPVPPDVRKQ